jgi:hypothetical protein
MGACRVDAVLPGKTTIEPCDHLLNSPEAVITGMVATGTEKTKMPSW